MGMLNSPVSFYRHGSASELEQHLSWLYLKATSSVPGESASSRRALSCCVLRPPTPSRSRDASARHSGSPATRTACCWRVGWTSPMRSVLMRA
jgi:hypothetical protein